MLAILQVLLLLIPCIFSYKTARKINIFLYTFTERVSEHIWFVHRGKFDNHEQTHTEMTLTKQRIKRYQLSNGTIHSMYNIVTHTEDNRVRFLVKTVINTL